MAKDSSFDIVSRVDRQEVKNALDQAVREIETRFDFRGAVAEVTLEDDGLLIHAQDDMRLKNIHQILHAKFIKRGLDFESLELKEPEAATKGTLRQKCLFKEGVDKDTGKQITQLIKEMGLKVKAQIQDEQVRVTGAKKDDLQTVIQNLKAQDLGRPLQFINFR